jgi:hypothetical protein
MTPENIKNERARLTALIADLSARLKTAKAEKKALPRGRRGRPKGLRMPSEVADHNHSAARRVLSSIQRHEIAQRKLRRPIKVPARKMEEFIGAACKAFPKAKPERVRVLVNINRKSGEDKDFSRGPIKRLIVDFDA